MVQTICTEIHMTTFMQFALTYRENNYLLTFVCINYDIEKLNSLCATVYENALYVVIGNENQPTHKHNPHLVGSSEFYGEVFEDCESIVYNL